jgi:hypothetical protein
MAAMNFRVISIHLMLFSLVLSACKASGAPPTPYRPPTAAIPPSPTLPPPATPEAPRPTPTPPCTDNLSFREDLTIPDGTQVSPGQALDKRWQVENSGTCNWDESYRLKLIAGPEMGAVAEQTLYPARSGTELVIRIVFTAPNEPGTYRSAWQAYNPRGEAFGDPVFIEVVVAAQ